MQPYPRTEVYGAQAMDVVFSDSGMGSAPADTDLCKLLDKESIRNVRISPFTDEGMMKQKLDATFGSHDWEMGIRKCRCRCLFYLQHDLPETNSNALLAVETMNIVIHLDLEHGHSWNYNTKAGLLDLYIRAGGMQYTDAMCLEVLKTEESNPLIKELREKFFGCRGTLDETVDSTATPLGEWARERRKSSIAVIREQAMRQLVAMSDATESLTYDEFYDGFLAPYHAHETSNLCNPLESKIVVQTLKFIDSDGNGRIEWGEFCLRAIWVLENRSSEETKWWSLRE